jgi:predicted metal-binding membrane protein
MSDATAIESLVKRDRLFTAVGLAIIVALCWVYLVVLATDMGGMSDMGGMDMATAWTATEFALMFVMWAVMMVAMMLPSAAPMILLFAAITRRNRDQGHVMAPTGIFAAGYLTAWAGFSLAATVLQWGFDSLALLSPMMASASAIFSGIILIAAGLYQWTPLKHACLAHCRSPLYFLGHHWRKGTGGAFVMGIHHGFYCVGCCWVLMALLFVGGVMNLLLIAAIALAVLIEKVVPRGDVVGRIGGGVLTVFGVYLILNATI